MSEPIVKLSGKCKIQVDTGFGTSVMEIPKLSAKDGSNNADELINQVLHFAIMRYGTDKVHEMVIEKFKSYEPKFKKQGIV